MTTDQPAIPVAEQFASIQGEGRYMGHPAVFLRTAGCNFICGGEAALDVYDGTPYESRVRSMVDEMGTADGTWVCDTIAEWMDGERFSIPELYDHWEAAGFLAKIDAGSHVVLTGGEPLLHQERLTAFLDYLEARGHEPFVEVESNASLEPTPAFRAHVDQYNLSPKLSNAGIEAERRYRPDVLKTFVEEFVHAGDDANANANADFKFVVGTRDDWAEIESEFLSVFDIPRQQVYLMPAGASQDDLVLTREAVAELAIEESVQFSERLQIVIWDEATGV